MGQLMTKFPGGGLEFGEGTIECLRREFKEELKIEIQSVAHFYTTDFFQVSAFSAKQQIISIYYTVASADASIITTKQNKYDFDNTSEGAQSFRWIAVKDLTIGEFIFPIDQKVAAKIIEG